MINYEKRFQEEMNSKFIQLPSGKVTANFGTNATFIPTRKQTYIEDFKRRYPTEYNQILNAWFDEVHH